jgi:hypothetical protein
MHDIKTYGLDPTNQYVTVNAWNEWSEGMVMEPSDLFGDGALHALRNVVTDPIDSKLCVLLAVDSRLQGATAQDLLKSIDSLTNDPSNKEARVEICVYAANPTPDIPRELTTLVRTLYDPRVRFVDIPLTLQAEEDQQANLTARLQYLTRRCHDINRSQWYLSMIAGDTCETGDAMRKVDWDNTTFTVQCKSSCQEDWEWKIERIDLLEMDSRLLAQKATELRRTTSRC